MRIKKTPANTTKIWEKMALPHGQIVEVYLVCDFPINEMIHFVAAVLHGNSRDILFVAAVSEGWQQSLFFDTVPGAIFLSS